MDNLHQYADENFKDLVNLLKQSQEKLGEMVDKNNQMGTEVNKVVASLTHLVRKIAVMQKRAK